MHLSDHNKNLFCTFLSGATSPFPHIYDAVSEQILLLIFKARQLNEDPEFSKWFAEQHRVLLKLQAQSEKIHKIYTQDSYPYNFEEYKQDKLVNALMLMHQLYAGFDEGKVSLQSWGDMYRQAAERGTHFAQQSKLLEEFIQYDVFNILNDRPINCLPIPSQDRKGYCHQDISIAHSCSKDLLSRLNDFHKIDTVQILSEAIYNLISVLRNHGEDIPAWLSEFEKVHTGILFGKRRENIIFQKIVNLINDEGRDNLIERISEQCLANHAEYLFNEYVGIYASEIQQWLDELLKYFKAAQSTSFSWKFTTVKTGNAGTSAQEEQQPSTAWDNDYCQISIKRDTLLELIRTYTLYDAVDSLADCLLHIYGQPAEQMLKEKGTLPPVSDNESEIHHSASWRFFSRTGGDYQKIISSIQTFEKWYENNKVLLVSPKKKRMEQIDVNVRLAGLKCYDLKMGIPNGEGKKIKDGVYDEVKNDPDLHLKTVISDVSLQRYHTQVKKIISSEIDFLLLSQWKNNSRHPFSGASRAIKPLWGKSEYSAEK